MLFIGLGLPMSDPHITNGGDQYSLTNGTCDTIERSECGNTEAHINGLGKEANSRKSLFGMSTGYDDVDLLLDGDGTANSSGPVDESILDMDADELATAVESAGSVASDGLQTPQPLEEAVEADDPVTMESSSSPTANPDAPFLLTSVDESVENGAAQEPVHLTSHDSPLPALSPAGENHGVETLEESLTVALEETVGEEFEPLDKSDDSAMLPLTVSTSEEVAVSSDETANERRRSKRLRSSPQKNYDLDACIDLGDSDDEDMLMKEKTAVKRAKRSTSSMASDNCTIIDGKAGTSTSIAVVKKPEPVKPPEFTYEDLLDRLTTNYTLAENDAQQIQRRLLDVLVSLINTQVQREPSALRKLIMDQQLILPNSITVPPSRVVDFLIEHEPPVTLAKALSKRFGDEKPYLTDAERRDRHALKSTVPAPAMTRVLMEIGQELVQEATYSDIVHGKNLPEMPKNMDTYKQVAAQLKPVWQQLKKKNEPFHLNMLPPCRICGFVTESRLVAGRHLQTLHYDGRMYQCAYCKEFDTSEIRMVQHYREEHNVKAIIEEPPAKLPCPLCPLNFPTKGKRELHFKFCRKDYQRLSSLLDPRRDINDISMVNRWLWERPTLDRTIPGLQNMTTGTGSVRLLNANTSKNTGVVSSMSSMIGKSTKPVVPINTAALQQQRFNFNAVAAGAPGTIAAALGMMQQQQRTTSMNVMPQGSPKKNPVGRPPGSRNQLPMSSVRRPLMPSISSVANAGNATTTAFAALLQQQQRMRQQQQQTNQLPGRPATTAVETASICEICDQNMSGRERYLVHLQSFHKQMKNKTMADMHQGAPLACSRCRERFWTYEGLERHLVMAHGLVTSDLLAKAQKKEDGGRCKLCGKQYAFNVLQHLVTDHSVKLCSAEIMYSCDVCAFKCTSYQLLEDHLTTQHPKQTPAPFPLPMTAAGTSTSASDNARIHQQRRKLNGAVPPAAANQMRSASAAKNKVPLFQNTTSAANRPTGRVKYTCTPCNLKFEQYAEVIAHWQTKHLKKVTIPLCRIDCCRTHRDEVDSQYNALFLFPEPSEPSEDDEIITLD